MYFEELLHLQKIIDSHGLPIHVLHIRKSKNMPFNLKLQNNYYNNVQKKKVSSCLKVESIHNSFKIC